MNHTWKKCGALLLALTLAAASLSGCSKSPEGESSLASQASGSSQTQSGSEAPAETGDYGTGLTEEGYFEGVKALEYVTLPDYKNMEAPADVTDITDNAVQEKIDGILASYATTEQIKDRAVEDGETVNIDYVGSVDGVEFEGGNTGGAGTTVTIGVTSYIDDFLDQLVGHKPGETFDVNVTFPENYGQDNLNGKDAVFKTTINYIQGETVNPELTDDFVTENLKEKYGWSTAGEMREGIRTDLRTAAVEEYLWQQVQEKSQVKEVPEAVANYYLQNMKNYYISLAEQYGVDLDSLLKDQLGMESMEELEEKNKDSLATNAKTGLILQALCEDMDIHPGEEDIKAFFQEQIGSEEYSSYEEHYGMPYLMMMIRESMAKSKLGESA